MVYLIVLTGWAAWKYRMNQISIVLCNSANAIASIYLILHLKFKPISILIWKILRWSMLSAPLMNFEKMQNIYRWLTEWIMKSKTRRKCDEFIDPSKWNKEWRCPGFTPAINPHTHRYYRTWTCSFSNSHRIIGVYLLLPLLFCRVFSLFVCLLIAIRRSLIT